MPGENLLSVTYNDRRISEGQIVEALLKGGIAIEGKQPPVSSMPSPFTYK
jgi:hypothetical protein